MIEGQEVTYAGLEDGGLAPGDQGKLLAIAGPGAGHVMWHTGRRAGDATLVETADLAQDPLVDSLSIGSISTFAVRQTFDIEGEAGVINAMASCGHLAAFSGIAEDALNLVTARIRRDPSFVAILSHLDDEEGESVLRLAAACLVRDAFGG